MQKVRIVIVATIIGDTLLHARLGGQVSKASYCCPFVDAPVVKAQ